MAGYPRCKNYWDGVFWNPDDNCPNIYVDGACAKEGTDAAKAGWGFRHGHGTKSNPMSNSQGGEVSGKQTELRGQLTAAKEALQWASYLPTENKVSIISKSENLMNQVYGKREPGNEDLWKPIDNLRTRVEASFETMHSYPDEDGTDSYFGVVSQQAKQNAGMVPKAGNSSGKPARR